MGKRPRPEETPSKYTIITASQLKHADLVKENKRCGLLARGDAAKALRPVLLQHIQQYGTALLDDTENEAAGG
eukprot:COSAG01_NODE_47999_length_385_cov_0.629371_1_plen_72_part_10